MFGLARNVIKIIFDIKESLSSFKHKKRVKILSAGIVTWREKFFLISTKYLLSLIIL